MHKIVASWKMGSAEAASALAALLLSLVAVQSAQAADKVGVAAAVKPEATSQPPGGETTTLNIGKSVLYNERIDTSSSGVVQVLLLDGSTFTVGPGSSLVIDKFVYNPSSGKGALVASFSKGALRFVGGKLSKQEQGIAVKTPAGALTVRGGIALIKVNGPNQAWFVFVFGKHFSLLRGGHLTTLTSTGQMFVVSGSGPAIATDASQADINAILAAVSGHKTKLAGKTVKGKPWPYYYGIQPTGYPDQPFIREWYYNNAATGLILSGATRNPPHVPHVPPPPPQVPPTLPPGGPCVTNRC